MAQDATPTSTESTTAVLDAATSSGAPGTPGGDDQIQPAPIVQPAKPDVGGFIWGTGRRKSAVARVRIKQGTGTFLINNREVDEFFTQLRDRKKTHVPLEATQMEGKLDVFVNVHGGGYTGQADAVLLGLARALKGYDPTLESILRDNGFLTRDPRRVERKKYGQPGARKRFQFSKR
jgi:small subunit ribosomal protein S9